LKAVAQDNTGLVTTSGVVNVSVVTDPGYGALRFDGTDDYVTMGAAPALGVTNFTLECWIYWTGGSGTASSGTGGVTGYPIVCKGSAEEDATSKDANYFFGIRVTDSVLGADFEEGAGQTSPGLNHPVFGATAVTASTWHHVAVTFDGANWALYLDGRLDGTLALGSGRLPRWDSIQHAAIAAAVRSDGARSPNAAPYGAFGGTIDEVRIWNYARTLPQLTGSMYNEVASAPGLIGRWSFKERSGTSAANTGTSGLAGTLLNGPVWTTGYPLLPVANQPPTVSITSPANGATVPTAFTIQASASDDDTVTNVAFYADGTVIGNDATAPYSFAWTGATVGSRALKAVARDNGGLATTSTVVTVTVSSNNPPATPALVAPANGATGVSTNATLTVSVSDPNSDPLAVTFYGRAQASAAPGRDFTVVACARP
jgi:hypothetical protein